MSRVKELVADVVQMYDNEGKCIGQIAAILQLTPSVVKQIVVDYSATWIDVSAPE
jgi:hypothetical protein